MENLKIAVVVADVDEYLPFLETVKQYGPTEFSLLKRQCHKTEIEGSRRNVTVYSTLCGIGKVNAAAMTAALLSFSPDVVLNFGYSGGIDGVSRGDFVTPERFLEHDFDLTGLGYKLCEKPAQEYIYSSDKQLSDKFCELFCGTKHGTAVSGDYFISSDTVRNTLKEEFGAMSCDMETAAIAYVCSASDIPFLSVRKISDDAGDSAKNDYREVNEKREITMSQAVLEFIRTFTNN